MHELWPNEERVHGGVAIEEIHIIIRVLPNAAQDVAWEGCSEVVLERFGVAQGKVEIRGRWSGRELELHVKGWIFVQSESGDRCIERLYRIIDADRLININGHALW